MIISHNLYLDKYRNNSKDNQLVRQVSDKQKNFAKKIAKELNIELTGDNKDYIKNFIDTNLEKYNQLLKDSPASQKQLDFVNKIADTLYIDIPDNFSHKDAKEFAKLDLIKEKTDEKFFKDFEEIDKKVQNGEISQDDDKLKDILDKGVEISLYLQETKEEIEMHINKEYLKEEFSEYIKEEDVHNASKLLEDNKEILDEFDYDRFEEQLDNVMNRLLDDKVKDIEHQIERRDEVEYKFMKEDENELDLENDEKEIEDDKDNENPGRERENEEEYEYER